MADAAAAVLDVLGGARAKLVRKIKFVAGLDTTFKGLEGLEVTNFGEDISVDFELGQMDDFATATAGAEFKGLWFVGNVGCEGGPWWKGRASSFYHRSGLGLIAAIFELRRLLKSSIFKSRLKRAFVVNSLDAGEQVDDANGLSYVVCKVGLYTSFVIYLRLV